MPIQAQMADGRVLEFPDDTDPTVIQNTVKRLIGEVQPPAPVERPSLGSPMGETFGAEIMAASELPKPTPRKTYTGSVFDTVDITKLPEPEFNPEEAARLSRRAYAEQTMQPPRRPPPELKPTPKEEIDRSIGGDALDTVIGVLQGAVSIPKGIVDNIPFDNPLSQFYKDAYEAGEKAKTGYLRSKNLQRSALLERVRENQGELAASRAAFNTMFSPSGADIVAKGAGSMVAPLGLSLYNLGTKSMVAMNALANAGDAAQQAAAQLASMSPEDWSKSDVYQALREKGLDHRDAVRILAPMYALPAQTVGAITGAVSGATGLEKALVKGGAQAVGSRLGRAGAETLGELSETLLPMVAGNAAQRLIDDQTNILKGTGQAAIETIAGALPGSALAAAAGERKPAVPTAEQMARERGFLVPTAEKAAVPPEVPPAEPPAPEAAPTEAAARAEQALKKFAESMRPAAPVEEGVPSGVETPEAVKAEEERPEAPPAVTPRTRTEAVEQHAVQGLPVVEAPVENIQLSEEVPQFKSDADIQGIVEPLEGKFERTGVAPIQLWKRKDGRLEVISGRHRFDLAKRSGEATIPAQIHDEAAGFDATKAATLDAELNIRDGQGKVKDYVVYFDKSGITRDEAESRGLLARPLGKRAWRIASEGSPELIAAHRADVVDDTEADAIAAAAPGNARLQAVGIKAIQSGKKAAAASNLIRAVSTLAIGREPVAEGADLFGFDESAMKEAEDMANVATRKQSELDNRLRAIQGAARRPEVAKAEGVDVKNPEAVRKRIDELKRQRSAWDNWSTNPELVNEIRRELRPEMELTAPTEAELRAEAERTAEEERRRRAEAEAPPPEEFTLTGSERAADEAAARGQRELEEAPVFQRALRGVEIPKPSATNKALATAFSDGDWAGVSGQLATSKNPIIASVGEMAKRLDGVTTEVNPAEIADANISAAGLYNPETKTIYARDKDFAASERVVAHEVVHALTVDAVRNPTKAQKAAVNRLDNLYRYVKTYISKRPLRKGEVPITAEGPYYGLKNIEEFIAEGMSNPEFQRELSKIPYQKQTAWGAFTKTIADILGIKDNNALAELIALTEELTTPEVVAEEKAAPVEGKPEKPPVLTKPEGFELKKGRNEQVVLAARELAAGRITKQEYDRYVDYYMPIEPVLGGKLEAPIEDDLMRTILTEKIKQKKDPKLVNAPIADGTRVGLRMDIPALDWGRANSVNGSVVSIHKGAAPDKTKGANLSYRSTGHIKNVVFAPRSEEKAFAIAQMREGKEGQKSPQQTMEGNWINTSPEETMRRVKALLDDPNWTQVSLDPLRHSYFYARDSRRPVLSADEALQVGRFVLVKNPVYGKREDFLYVEIPEERPEERAGLARQKESLLVSRDELGRRGFGAGAKAYDAVAKVANAVLDKVSMKPISPELSRAMRNMKAVVAKAQKEVAGLAKELGGLSEAERKMVSDVIEGELEAGVHPPQHVLNIAASMQEIMSRQSEELVRLKMLSPEAAARWENKYLPRFYENKLRDDINAWSNAVKKLLGRQPVMRGIRGAQLKSRGMYEVISADDLPNWIAEGWEQRDPSFNPKTSTETVVWRDYTREEREKMGEIRDAMFRFVMGYNASQRDIALGRLYEDLARDYASTVPEEGYVRVPDTEVEGTMASRYGALAGMYVPKEIFDHLVANDEALTNGVLKIYRAALRKWKEGKTVLNPVSHANNIISNLTMAHFAGVSYWDGQKYAGAIKDLVKNDPMVKEAQDVGLFGGTFNQSELVDSMPPELRALANKTESQAAKIGEGIWDALAFTASYGGKKYGARPVMQWAYDGEDQFFRYLIYRDARQKGLDPEDAREYSQQFIFTYDDLPAGARALRDYGMPFFSYTYKVVPVLARTALEYPWRYAAPAGVAYAVNAMMYAMAASLGGNDDDWWGKTIARYVTDPEFRKKAKEMEAEERRKLPEWMKGHSAILATPKAIRMGIDEATSLPLFLDISRIFPGGDLLDANNNSGGVALLQPLFPANPVFTGLVAILGNLDLFYGKPVTKQSDTEAEKARKRADWIWKQVTPAISVGNYHFDRGMNVLANMTGKPITIDAGPMGVVDYTGVGKDGLPVQPKYALAQTFGIKIRPYDFEVSEKIEEANKAKLIKEISAEISRLNRLESKGAVSPEAAEKLREQARVKRARLKEGLTVEGKEKD